MHMHIYIYICMNVFIHKHKECIKFIKSIREGAQADTVLYVCLYVWTYI